MTIIQYGTIGFGVCASACLWGLAARVWLAGKMTRRDASVAIALAITFASQAYATTCTTAIAFRGAYDASLLSDDFVAALQFTKMLAACIAAVVMIALFRQLEDYP